MNWANHEDLWRTAVEISLLAMAIYFVLKSLRGTRGWAVILGVAVLVAFRVVTDALDLRVLAWLLNYFYALLAIATLILFQPELRRMLAELGKMRIFYSTHEKREDIEVVVQAAERMAEMRIGALMAIEQTIPVQEAVESGMVVDCEATPEMLETIFFPNNAIHDGGVLMKDGRITHAACIFPLTQRQDLHKSMGTRHRAAIGLSEETDAVVIVVSEETGLISHAFKGQLVRGVSAEDLRAFLTSVLIAPRRARTWRERVAASPRAAGKPDSAALSAVPTAGTADAK